MAGRGTNTSFGGNLRMIMASICELWCIFGRRWTGWDLRWRKA